MTRHAARRAVRCTPRLRSIALGTILLASCARAPVAAKPVAPPALQGGADTANVSLRAVYDVTRTETAAPGDGSAGEEVTGITGTVRITANVLAVREGDVEQLYDFANRRIIWLDHAKKQAHETSLYLLAALRDIQLESSKSFAQIGEQMGQAMDLVDMADVETELGLRQDPPAQVRLEEQRRGDLRVFVLNGREVTAFLGADRTPPPPSPMLTRFYLYATHLHPLVRAELVKAARLPARLEFRWNSTPQERTRTTWTLRELVDEPFDVAAATATYPMKPIESEELIELAWRVRAGQAGTSPPSAAYIDRAKRLLDEGRGLEAFLKLLELQYATGDAPSDLLRKSGERARSDPRMKAVAKALDGMDPEKALAQLEALDPLSLEGGAVIHVLRANQWFRLLEGKEVLQEFGRTEPLQELGLALKANPFLVGAWVDAGLFSYAGWQTQRAWACWDAARAIAPESDMLKAVDELEASLRKRHPEYF